MICFVALVLAQLTGGWTNTLFFSVYHSSLLDPLTYVRFIGHIFGIPLTFILVAVIYIGQQVYAGLFIQDNVANLTHILGGFVGAVLGFIMNKNKMSRY